MGNGAADDLNVDDGHPLSGSPPRISAMMQVIWFSICSIKFWQAWSHILSMAIRENCVSNGLQLVKTKDVCARAL